MKQRRKPEIIAGRVNIDASISTGDGFIVVKIGTGQYQVVFSPGFRLLSLTAVSTGNYNVASVSPFTGDRVNVNFSSTTGGGTLVDTPFSFVAAGIQQ